MCCFKCGNMLPDDSQFCQYCGSDLKKVQTPCTQNHINEDTYDKAVIAPKGSPKKKKWPLFLVFGVTTVFAVCLFALRGGHQSSVTPSEAAKNVLYIEVYDESDMCIGNGSGFLVNNNITLVTNYHVIENAFTMIAMTADGQHFVGVDTILAYDESADLAILQCQTAVGASPLVLADSDLVKQGDTVYAAGYPLGIVNTLSDGIVSSRYEENGVDILQITTPISEGSSGGALMNQDGEVIGVICGYYEGGQNMNIAIASNEVASLLQKENDVLTLEEFYLSSHWEASNPNEENVDNQSDTAEIVPPQSTTELPEAVPSQSTIGSVETVVPSESTTELPEAVPPQSITESTETAELPQGETESSDITTPQSKTDMPVDITTEANQESEQPLPEPEVNVYKFLCEWVSDNYNKTLKYSGGEDKAYQEIVMENDSRDTYQIVYCEDIDRICLRYIASKNTGASITSSIWLKPQGNS